VVWGDIALARLLEAEVGQLHVRSEVEATAAVLWREGNQSSAREVQRLERDIAEVHDLSR